MMHPSSIVTLCVVAVTVVYYSVVVGANKKYRTYVQLDNFTGIVSVFVALLTAATMAALGVHCATSGGAGTPCMTYAWVLAGLTVAIAATCVASSIFTQIKLRSMPAGSVDQCGTYKLFQMDTAAPAAAKKA